MGKFPGFPPTNTTLQLDPLAGLKLANWHLTHVHTHARNCSAMKTNTLTSSRVIIGSKSAIPLQRGPVNPKFQVQGVAPPTNHSPSQKTRVNALSRGIKIWTDFSFVLSQSTRLTDRQTDGQTDRRTDRNLMVRPRFTMQRGKNVTFWCRPPSIWQKCIFTIFTASGDSCCARVSNFNAIGWVTGDLGLAMFSGRI